jgi:hypothetical protein
VSCPTHALCEDCYAGMVDVGEARSDPIRVVVDLNGTCCACGATATLYLSADPARFQPHHGHHFRTENQDTAAMVNRRDRQVVQTDQPQVGQDSQPS